MVKMLGYIPIFLMPQLLDGQNPTNNNSHQDSTSDSSARQRKVNSNRPKELIVTDDLAVGEEMLISRRGVM